MNPLRAGRALMLLVVALGGMIGTGVRAGLTSTWSYEPGAFPFATMTVNIVGAFLLGLLLERLAAAGAETPRRLLLRLGLGTGVLGGLTTFSGLAIDVVTLVQADLVVLAAGYALGSMVLGLAVCMLGVAAGARRGGLR